MERSEAEAIYERGRETVVAVLLELSAQNALLARQVAELSGRVAKQDERIAELELQLKRNSSNSSTPPSQDPPGAPERKPAPASGRGQGAQPGHPGRGRRLLPAEAVDLVVEHWPEHCRCGQRFDERGRHPLGEPACLDCRVVTVTCEGVRNRVEACNSRSGRGFSEPSVRVEAAAVAGACAGADDE